jgi:hypothetical protein
MTEAQYWKKVQKYADTEGCNGALLAQLRMGFDKWNVLFLDKLKVTQSVEPISKKLVVNKLDTKIGVEPTGNDADTEGYRNDATSLDLAVRMRHLIGVKRSLSNSLFDHQQNRLKCKEISGKILAYERDIETLRDQLRHYNQHGTLPTEPTTEKGEYIFPSTKYELDKALRGVRSMICQVELECEKLVVQGETAKLKKREQRLVVLKIRKDELDNRLKNAIDVE